MLLNKIEVIVFVVFILCIFLVCGGDENFSECFVEMDCVNGYFCNNESVGYFDKVFFKYMGFCLLEEIKSCFELECEVKGCCVYDVDK